MPPASVMMRASHVMTWTAVSFGAEELTVSLAGHVRAAEEAARRLAEDVRELAADQVTGALPLRRRVGVHLLADGRVRVAGVKGEEGAVTLLLLLEEGAELATRRRVLVQRLLAAAEEGGREALRLGRAVLVIHGEQEEHVRVVLVRVDLADDLVELVIRVRVLGRRVGRQLDELTSGILVSARPDDRQQSGIKAWSVVM